MEPSPSLPTSISGASLNEILDEEELEDEEEERSLDTTLGDYVRPLSRAIEIAITIARSLVIYARANPLRVSRLWEDN